MRHVLSLLLMIFFVFATSAFPWSGKVVGISDGDTIKVLHEGRSVKVRLFGVDCPEGDQDYGSKAKRFTGDMVFNKVVEVNEVEQDVFGRSVAWVTVDGKSLNTELVAAGMAWWFRRYAPSNLELRELETQARRKQLGLWSLPNPVPPWKFRRGQDH